MVIFHNSWFCGGGKLKICRLDRWTTFPRWPWPIMASTEPVGPPRHTYARSGYPQMRSCGVQSSKCASGNLLGPLCLQEPNLEILLRLDQSIKCSSNARWDFKGKNWSKHPIRTASEGWFKHSFSSLLKRISIQTDTSRIDRFLVTASFEYHPAH